MVADVVEVAHVVEVDALLAEAREVFDLVPSDDDVEVEDGQLDGLANVEDFWADFADAALVAGQNLHVLGFAFGPG